MEEYLLAAQDLVNMDTSGDMAPFLFRFGQRYGYHPQNISGLRFRRLPDKIIYQNDEMTAVAERMREDYYKKFLPPINSTEREPEFVSAENQIINTVLNNTAYELHKHASFFFNQTRTQQLYPLDFLEERYRRHKAILPIQVVGQPEGIQMKLFDGPPPSFNLDDMIDFYVYLKPAFEGKADQWYRSRLCAECGKFFFYERDTARFCTKKCRMAAAYKMRRKKDEK